MSHPEILRRTSESGHWFADDRSDEHRRLAVSVSAAFDRDSWERRRSQALQRGAHAVDRRPPNAHPLAEAAGLRPGLALDAGAGHGSETLGLSARGWRVTAVDFSTTALDHARVRAESLDEGAAEGIDWVGGDLATLDAVAGPLRPGDLPVRPRRGLGRRHGAATGRGRRGRRGSRTTAQLTSRGPVDDRHHPAPFP